MKLKLFFIGYNKNTSQVFVEWMLQNICKSYQVEFVFEETWLMDQHSIPLNKQLSKLINWLSMFTEKSDILELKEDHGLSTI